MATLQEGTLAADGTVQDVITGSNKNISKKRVEGYIDLSNMQGGDTVVITHYVKITNGGSFIAKWQASYSGAQPTGDKLKGFPAHFYPYGIQIQLQQTAGVNRNYPFYFEKY